MSDERIEQRAAGLLPEEIAAGSADPHAQAAAILADSDARSAAGAEGAREQRRSDETFTPGDTTL